MRKQRNLASLRSMYGREPWSWLLAQGDDSLQIVTVGKLYYQKKQKPELRKTMTNEDLQEFLGASGQKKLLTSKHLY